MNENNPLRNEVIENFNRELKTIESSYWKLKVIENSL